MPGQLGRDLQDKIVAKDVQKPTTSRKRRKACTM